MDATALNTWRRLAVLRYPTHGLLDRIWQLRHNVSAYDATYVALAEGLDARRRPSTAGWLGDRASSPVR
jgi:predicted nucleic acid-binding protein